MVHAFRSRLAAFALGVSLLFAPKAEARDYTQTPTQELHDGLDKRPMAAPIAVTIVGGISLIAGGYLALYGLSLQAACQIVETPCNANTQIAVGGVMAGAGAVATTVGTVWLINWDQTRREISSELARRQTSAKLGVAPLLGPSQAGFQLTGTF
jgi:hypothetical protein